MPLPKPKLLAGWRRAKLIALINELYLSFRGCGTCGVVVNALRCPQIHRLDLFVTRWPSTCDAQRNQNSEPKLRPPAVSKSLTRSTIHNYAQSKRKPGQARGTRSHDGRLRSSFPEPCGDNRRDRITAAVGIRASARGAARGAAP